MTVRVWTIQQAEVWERLRRDKILYVGDDNRTYVPPAYRWLQSQLRERLSNYSGHLPWWAYCEKPDLRRYRHLLTRGMTYVRLELHVAEASVLQFPSWAWQRVFCGDYLALTRTEYEDWYRQLPEEYRNGDTWPPPEPWKSQLERSWERLFGAELPLVDWNTESLVPPSARSEAVFEPLRLQDVRHVTCFRGTFYYDAKTNAEAK